MARYAATHRLVVATSDRLETQTAITFGASLCVSAEGLRAWLDAARRDYDRRAHAHRRKH